MYTWTSRGYSNSCANAANCAKQLVVPVCDTIGTATGPQGATDGDCEGVRVAQCRCDGCDQHHIGSFFVSLFATLVERREKRPLNFYVLEDGLTRKSLDLPWTQR